jgi:translation initiation factor 2B subunit (eIF-2B alpha/beta/delta family)
MTPDDPVVAAFRRAAADRAHGAGEIEARLIRELLEMRPRWSAETLDAGGALLAAGQPMMANLRALAAFAGEGDDAALDAHLMRRAEVLDTLPGRLAGAAWPHVERAARLVTLSRSSAVAAVVEGARARGWHGMVVVLDGTPAGRGPEQAAALAASGPTLSQPDATAPRWLEGDGVVVAVGADAVSERRVLNCTGTAALLELAAVRGLPRLLVADTGKDVSDDVLDDMAAATPRHRDPAGREFPVFETAPLLLITARISEENT